MKPINIATILTIIVLFALVFWLAKTKPPTIIYSVTVYSPYDPADAVLVRFAGDKLMCFMLDPK